MKYFNVQINLCTNCAPDLRECLLAETCACSRLRRSLSDILFCDSALRALSQNKISFWCGEAARLSILSGR